jgi:outer membrane protein OmpA-like peptidoglycan-associated protein
MKLFLFAAAVALSLLSARGGRAASRVMTLDVCPNSYEGFHEDAPPLRCGCQAEAVKIGPIYGANPYYWQSAICRAALQAGVIGPTGGQVLVTPEKAPVFPGITRHGVSSRPWGADFGFRVAPDPSSPPEMAMLMPPPGLDANGHPARLTLAPPPGLDASSRPIQAPIGETLRTQGKVQVYINFATDKAVLQPSSTPVLSELLAALSQRPELKVDLIGHTDDTGSDAHNQDLSRRRAAAVYLWLVEHGISRERLHSEGRGFLEPIATNETAAGRALNRRVEVKAVN